VGCGRLQWNQCAGARAERAELVAVVHKAACDLAATRLDAMTCSIGADIAGVDAEVRRLRADLESAKEVLRRTCSGRTQSSPPCRRRRIVSDTSRLRSRVSNKTLSARAAPAKPWRWKSRSCAGSLKPQLVASQECNGRGEGCNAMSQQNLEEEAGCGQTDCRKMKNFEAGYGQADCR